MRAVPNDSRAVSVRCYIQTDPLKQRQPDVAKGRVFGKYQMASQLNLSRASSYDRRAIIEIMNTLIYCCRKLNTYDRRANVPSATLVDFNRR